MPKTIKFNLILDGKPIRDIEGLQNNFCIDDVLSVYENGLLERWLKVRNFDDHLKKIRKVKKDDGVIKQLIKIFEIKKSEEEIMEGIYSLSFWNERKTEIEVWLKKDTAVKQIIADYHNGYDVLKVKILENKEDMSFLKQATITIFLNYLEIFKIDFIYFFEFFRKDAPLIIYAILMNNNLRKFYLENDDIKSNLDSFALYSLNEARKNLYSHFSLFDQVNDEKTNETEIIDKLQKGIQLHTFCGKTDGYWKDLEILKTKVMVLSIPDGTFIRNVNKPKEELSAEDVNGNFLILDGLVYKSNIENKSIVYMEV